LSIVLEPASIGVISEVTTGCVLGLFSDMTLFSRDSVENNGSIVVVGSVIAEDPIVSDRVGTSVSGDETIWEFSPVGDSTFQFEATSGIARGVVGSDDVGMLSVGASGVFGFIKEKKRILMEV
jgi:hypothetical protein